MATTMTADELCPDVPAYTFGCPDVTKVLRLDEKAVRRIVEAHRRNPAECSPPQELIRRIEHGIRHGHSLSMYLGTLPA